MTTPDSFAAAASTCSSSRLWRISYLGIRVITIKEGVFELIEYGLEPLHLIVVWLEEIFDGLGFVFVKCQCLETRVKLLNGWILKVTRIEINSQILDEKLSCIFLFSPKSVDNSWFSLTLLCLLKPGGFHNPIQVSDIVSIG